MKTVMRERTVGRKESGEREGSCQRSHQGWDGGLCWARSGVAAGTGEESRCLDTIQRATSWTSMSAIRILNPEGDVHRNHGFIYAIATSCSFRHSFSLKKDGSKLLLLLCGLIHCAKCSNIISYCSSENHICKTVNRSCGFNFCDEIMSTSALRQHAWIRQRLLSMSRINLIPR